MCVICLFGLTFRTPSRGTCRANTLRSCWQSYHESCPAAVPPQRTAGQTSRLQRPFMLRLVISRTSHALRGVKPRTAVSNCQLQCHLASGLLLKSFFPSQKAHTMHSRDEDGNSLQQIIYASKPPLQLKSLSCPSWKCSDLSHKWQHFRHIYFA